jgi:hypothetical protein
VVAIFLEGEVACVEEVELQGLQVPCVRVRPRGGEDLIVLPPHEQRRRLMLAEVGVPRRVERHVGPVVVEQGQLDVLVAGPVEARLVEGLGVRADGVHMADAVGVLPLRPVEGQEPP